MVELFVGIVAAVLSVISLVLSVRTARKAEERHKAEQAAKLSSWVAHRYSNGGGANTALGNALYLYNGSDGPVYDVEIHAIMHERQAEPFKCNVVPPGEHLAMWEGYRGSTTRGDWAFFEPVSSIGDFTRPYSNTRKWMVTRMLFTDSFGQRWSRSASGQLSLEPSGGRVGQS